MANEREHIIVTRGCAQTLCELISATDTGIEIVATIEQSNTLGNWGCCEERKDYDPFRIPLLASVSPRI